jgi:O-antigen/teichoic acid export membrane protein
MTSRPRNPRSVSRLKLNIAANFVGRVWAAAISLLLVPIYIQFMGIEAYGLVGFFTTLLALSTLLDMGLSTTINRELAILAERPQSTHEMRDLVRTLEIVYWCLALILSIVTVASSPLIANSWINAESLPLADVQQAVMLMGVALTFQFPLAFYTGGLQGLQQQVILNGVTVVASTLRGIGAVVVLWLVSPTVQVFFSWQIVINGLQTVCCAILLWQRIPRVSQRPRFQMLLLKQVWRFAAGMTGISILSLILTQVDKVILSGLLSLEMFGYYSLATVIASGLAVVIGPIFLAVFPRLSQLVAIGDEFQLSALYHRSCQLMSVIILPITIVVALFSHEIIYLWTGDIHIAQEAHTLASLLIIGTALNGLMNVPYALQLAYGWTKLALYQNIVAVLVLVPLLFWITGIFGAVGAAMIWILLNAGYVLIGIQIMHTRLLSREKYRWYIQDVGLPLVGSLLFALLLRWYVPSYQLHPALITWLGFIFVSTLTVSALSAPYTRNLIRQVVLR